MGAGCYVSAVFPVSRLPPTADGRLPVVAETVSLLWGRGFANPRYLGTSVHGMCLLSQPAGRRGDESKDAVSYTHLTLPTNREV